MRPLEYLFLVERYNILEDGNKAKVIDFVAMAFKKVFVLCLMPEDNRI
jgi:hypothetical protein